MNSISLSTSEAVLYSKDMFKEIFKYNFTTSDYVLFSKVCKTWNLFFKGNILTEVIKRRLEELYFVQLSEDTKNMGLLSVLKQFYIQTPDIFLDVSRSMYFLDCYSVLAIEKTEKIIQRWLPYKKSVNLTLFSDITDTKVIIKKPDSVKEVVEKMKIRNRGTQFSFFKELFIEIANSPALTYRSIYIVSDLDYTMQDSNPMLELIQNVESDMAKKFCLTFLEIRKGDIESEFRQKLSKLILEKNLKYIRLTDDLPEQKKTSLVPKTKKLKTV